MEKGKDILSEFGGESMENASRASGGGGQTTRDVNNYKPPVGPTNINDGRSVGLHGTVRDCGTQGKH